MNSHTRNQVIWKSVLILGFLAFLLLWSNCRSIPPQSIQIIEKDSGEKEAELDTDKAKDQKKTPSVEWLQQPVSDQVTVEFAKPEKKGPYLMNFPNEVEIPKFIDAMMSGIFKLNYVLAEGVKKETRKVSIKMTEDLSREDTFQVFEKILELYSIRIEKEANTYIFNSAGTRPMGGLRGPIVYGRKLPDNMPLYESDEVTFLVPIHFLSMRSQTFTTLQQIIQRQLQNQPTQAVLPVYEANLLLLCGRYEDIKYVIALIDIIDRPQFKEKSIVMLYPKYWGITDFVDKVTELLAAEGIDIKGGQAGGGMPGAPGGADQSRSINFIPIENLNYLLVISQSKDLIERVIYWMSKLDVPEAAGESKKVFCYKLKNVKVESVMRILEEFQSQGLGGTTPRVTPRYGPGGNAGPGGPGGNPGGYSGSSSLEKNLIPINDTNSIIIVADPVEYKKYSDILKKIDTPRNQVFVEMIVGEVSVDSSTQMGLEFWINKYLYKTEFGTRGGLGVFKPLENGGFSIPSGSNMLLKGILPGNQYELLINALVTNSKINIISSPKLTVVENQEAELKVGSSVPTISGESSMGGGYSGSGTGTGGTGTGGTGGTYLSTPYRNITYVDTGIILKLKASILSDNKISLEITQEISEAQANSKSDIQSPEILKRNLKTTMIVNEGEIGFVGGLIQNKKTSAKSGIPILSQIPLLGNLFKKSTSIERKTELVFFINAKTIRRNNQMNEIVNAVKSIITEHSYLEDENEK